MRGLIRLLRSGGMGRSCNDDWELGFVCSLVLERGHANEWNDSDELFCSIALFGLYYSLFSS